MDGGYALPRPVRVLEDETLASLVTRNAATYRFADPMLVLAPLELGKIELGRVTRLPPTSALACLLGVDVGTLKALSSWSATSGMASVGEHEIRPMFLDGYVRRSCPHCLRESLHHRAFWDVLAIDVCPRHGTVLTRRCPGCGKAPLWAGYRLDRCGNSTCSFDLTCAGPASADPMPVGDHVQGLHALYVAGPEASLPGTGLAFGRAVEAAFGLGCHGSSVRRSGRSDSFLRRHSNRVPGLMERGWQVLSRWPHRFYEMLDELRSRASTRKEVGLRREFGTLSTWLSGGTKEAWSEPLRKVFAAYLERQPDMVVSVQAVRRYGHTQIASPDDMTMNGAAAFLGLSKKTMMDLAERRNLYAVRGAVAGSGILLRADMVHALKALKEACLQHGEAATTLGIGHVVLSKLLKSGLLASVPPEDRVTQHHVVLRSDVEALLDRAYATLEPSASRRKLVPLAFAMAGQRDTVDVLQAVLKGRLCARGTTPGDRNLSQLLFDSQEVRDAIPVKSKVAKAARVPAIKTNMPCRWTKADRAIVVDTPGHERDAGTGPPMEAVLLVPDALWAAVAGLLPSRQRQLGRPYASDRVIVAGILSVLHTGSGWQELPPNLGCSWQTCLRRLREWQAGGVWPRLHQVLLEQLPGAAALHWHRLMEGASIVVRKDLK